MFNGNIRTMQKDTKQRETQIYRQRNKGNKRVLIQNGRIADRV